MTTTLINPVGLVDVPVYHHVSIAAGSRHIHLAGQVAWDENGALVGEGDLAAQVAQVHRNVAKGLEAAGATFHDVVRITWYAAGWKPEMYDAFLDGVAQAAREFDLPTPPAALIGVEILFQPGILIEAEVTAITAGWVRRAAVSRPRAGPHR